MSDQTKNLIDVILTGATLIGAALAFAFGLHQWRRSQAWQRADQLNKFVEKFETNQFLRLATVIIDWYDRETTFSDKLLTVWNDESLLALRDHREIVELPMFPGEQATLRDAYDAILTFFCRLELAIETHLIDVEPTKAYFGYWLDHFLRFDKDPDKNKVLADITPASLVTKYIEVYSDIESIRRLCKRFKLAPPVPSTAPLTATPNNIFSPDPT